MWLLLPHSYLLLTRLASQSASNSSHYREEWSIWPPTLESLLFDRGYMIYESAPTAEAVASDGSNLYIRDVRDRAYVFVNNTSGGGSISRAGVFQRNLSNAWAPSPFIPVTMPSPRHPTPDNRILVLVENEGRVCFGPHLGADPKGLPSGVLSVCAWYGSGQCLRPYALAAQVYNSARGQTLISSTGLQQCFQ